MDMESLLKSALKHAEKGKEWLMEDVPLPMEDEMKKLAEDVKDRVADTVADTAAAAAAVGETVKAVVVETVATSSADTPAEAAEQPVDEGFCKDEGFSGDEAEDEPAWVPDLARPFDLQGAPAPTPSAAHVTSQASSVAPAAVASAAASAAAAPAPAPAGAGWRQPEVARQEASSSGSAGAPGTAESPAELRVLLARVRAELRTEREQAEAAARKVARLQSQLTAEAEEHEAALRAAEDRLVELEVEAQDLRARASKAEGRAESARQELCELRETHASELARLTERRDLALEYELRATSELKALKRELADLRGAEAVTESADLRGERRPWSDEEAPSKEDLEIEEPSEQEANVTIDLEDQAAADAERPLESSAAQPQLTRNNSEAVVLRERIEVLEKRCVTLQKKLNARPIMYQPLPTAPVSGGGVKRLEPMLRAAIGHQHGELVTKLLGVPERALRGFTANLLKYDAWFAIFYVHLLVLYAVVASCLTETAGTIGADVSDINLRQADAPAAAAGAAAVGAALR